MKKILIVLLLFIVLIPFAKNTDNSDNEGAKVVKIVDGDYSEEQMTIKCYGSGPFHCKIKIICDNID